MGGCRKIGHRSTNANSDTGSQRQSPGNESRTIGKRAKPTARESGPLRKAAAVFGTSAVLTGCVAAQADENPNPFPDYSGDQCRIGNADSPWESERYWDEDNLDNCAGLSSDRAFRGECGPLDVVWTAKYQDWWGLEHALWQVMRCVSGSKNNRYEEMWANHAEEFERVFSDIISRDTASAQEVLATIWSMSRCEGYGPAECEIGRRLLARALESEHLNIRASAAIYEFGRGNRDGRIIEILLEGMASDDWFIRNDAAESIVEGGIASPEALEVLYDRLQERFPHHIWGGVLSDLVDLAVCNPDLIPRTLDILELNCRILGPRARFVRLYLEIYEDDRRAVMENVRTILESGHVSLGSLEEDQALRILAMGVRDPRYGVSSTARDVMVNVCQVEPESE